MDKKIVKVEFVVEDNYEGYEKAIKGFEESLEEVGAKNFSAIELDIK